MSRCLAFLMFTGLLLATADAAQTIMLLPGQAKRFDVAVVEGTPLLQHEKLVPLGPSDPPKGQIQILFAPPGHAVQMAKVHIYVRAKTALGFHVTAFDGTNAIGQQDICGGIDLDSWAAFPAQTSRIIISDVAEVRSGCP